MAQVLPDERELRRVIGDGEGILTLTFFNQAWRSRDLVPGARGIFAGKVGDYRGLRQLAHPDYELFDASHEAVAGIGDAEAQAFARQPIPIYPASASVAGLAEVVTVSPTFESRTSFTPVIR